jgi:hypothetical protein
MSRSRRLWIALLIGLLSGLGCYLRLSQRAQLAADFTFPWRAAQLLLAGENPYLTIQPSGEYPYQTYFYYPIQAALAAIPLAWLPPYLAGALFFAIGSGLLAYFISRSGWGQMPLFLSAPFFVAAAVAQWSPLLTAAALAPWLQWLLVCKPNVGAALFLYNPSRRGLATMLLFLALGFLVLPTWLFDWFEVARDLAGHPPPFLVLPFGPLLLLAALRWRRAENRLLLGLSLLPQLLFFYDQLPLWLLPRSFAGSLAYSALSWVAYFAWRWRGFDPQSGEVIAQPSAWVIALIYLPALLMSLWPESLGLRDAMGQVARRITSRRP